MTSRGNLSENHLAFAVSHTLWMRLCEKLHESGVFGESTDGILDERNVFSVDSGLSRKLITEVEIDPKMKMVRNIVAFQHASMPLKSIHITSRFGMRHHPILHRYCMHNGVDLKAHYENVFSMFPGRVVSIGQNKRSGKYVVIQTAGYSISYCHLSSILVRDSQYVNAGEVIAISGNTGMSTGPHLHLTTKKDGKVIDPAILLVHIQSNSIY